MNPNHDAGATDHFENDDEISIFDLFIFLAKYKKLILGLPFVVAVISAIFSLTLPAIYTADTALLPPAQSQSTGSSLLAQLGGLTGIAGAGSRNSTDVYIAMLKSRTVADSLIQRFAPMKRLKFKSSQEGYRWLEGNTRIALGGNGLLIIEVDDEDPKFAAELANAYVGELFNFSKVLAVTEASQRRLFYERQLDQARDNLAKVENAAKQALEKGGLVQVEGQGRAMIEANARLRGQITAKEVQIGAMRMFAAERNPELLAAQNELQLLKRELAKMEGDSGGNVRGRDVASDGQGIDSVNLLRDVKYYETTYELLAKQYEIARIDEAKDPGILQVMDKAIEPDQRSKPVRRKIVLFSVAVALLAAVLLAFAIEAMANASRDPRQTERRQTLRRYMSWR